MLGATSHETSPFLKLTRNMSHSFLRRLKDESLKKLCLEFSRIVSRILVVLSSLGEFLLNRQLPTRSRTVAGTFRNTNVENREPFLILKWDPPSVSPVIQLIQTQTKLLTVRPFTDFDVLRSRKWSSFGNFTLVFPFCFDQPCYQFWGFNCKKQFFCENL